MATPTMKMQLEKPAGVTCTWKQVSGVLTLIASTTDDAFGDSTGDNVTVGGPALVKPDGSGLITLANMRPNTGSSADVIDSPANTYYQLVVKYPNGTSITRTFTVPDAAGPFWIQDYLHTPPSSLPGQLGWYNVATYGAIGDGTTDDTTAVQAAITAAAATGGTVWFPTPSVAYKITADLTIPNNGATPPRQRALRFLGSAADMRGATDTTGSPYGGAVIDYQSGTLACIDTRGDGHLEISGLFFMQGGTAHTLPYIRTTNTTLHVHECGFLGHQTKSTTSCDQDAIVLGGTSTTLDGSSNAAFQGYGTVIQNNWFNRIRRITYGRTYCNGVVIRDNVAWWKCGGSAGIEFDGGPDNCVGNVIDSNMWESSGYTYGIKLTKAVQNVIIGNGFPDINAGVMTACIRFEATAEYNLVVQGQSNDTVPHVSDASGGTNTILTSHQSQTSTFSQPVAFTNTGTGVTAAKFTATGGSNAFLVKPSAAIGVEGAKLLKMSRADAEGTNPGGEVANITQSGILELFNATGTSIKIDCSAAGLNVYPGSGAGGTFTINTGTGGSALQLRAAATLFLDYSAGAERARIRSDMTTGTHGALQFDGTSGPMVFSGTGAPEGIITAPKGSLYLRTDGGAGTSLYIREVGAGNLNTGWAAK